MAGTAGTHQISPLILAVAVAVGQAVRAGCLF